MKMRFFRCLQETEYSFAAFVRNRTFRRNLTGPKYFYTDSDSILYDGIFSRHLQRGFCNL
jgi:hypothetical protein